MTRKPEARTQNPALIPAGDAATAKELPARAGALGPAPAAQGSASAAERPIPWGNGTDPSHPFALAHAQPRRVATRG